MEAEQRRLYNHFVALSKNGKTDEQMANCKKYAAEILASFPQFLKKVEVELTPAQKGAATKAAKAEAAKAEAAKAEAAKEKPDPEDPK